MAITYTTGTINAADAVAVSLAMVEKIRDDVVAHAAWDLADEFTAASGLGRWYVFQCLAAQSGLSSDFYVVINRVLSTGELRGFICEGYNSTTKVVSYFGAYTYGSTSAFDSLGRTSITYTLAAAILPSSIAGPKWTSWTPSGTSTKWWITVSEDGFTVAFNGASNGYKHFGAYTPLASVTIPLALQCISHNSGEGSITRNPSVANTTVNLAATIIQGGGGDPAQAPQIAPPLGFAGSMRYNDHLLLDQRAMAEQGITMFNQYNGPPDAAVWGWALGKQKRMRVGLTGTSPPGITFGDAYSILGRLWIPYVPTGFQLWDTGVAG